MDIGSNWNLKTILLSASILVILGLAAYSVHRPIRDNRERQKEYYNAETKGVVYRIDKKDGISQRSTGNKRITLWYKVNYYYEVDGNKHFSSDYIKGTTIEENRFINYATRNINKDKFTVRYATSEPSKSFLVKTPTP